MKQGWIRPRRTDHHRLRVSAKGLQCLLHRPTLHDQAIGELKQPPVPIAKPLKLRFGRRIRAAEVNHKRHPTPGSGLHHPHGVETEIHQHHIRAVPLQQKPGGAGCRQRGQAQQTQHRECLAEEHRQTMGKSQGTAEGSFIPENSGFAEGQPAEIGPDEGLRCSPPTGRQQQHMQRHQSSCPSACIN